ncbi:MAG: hypothetical protein JSS30_03600 [Verrucomicrobia bacterium]|nr:hypothetical protein [Verrucomicrobiota bacterium]
MQNVITVASMGAHLLHAIAPDDAPIKGVLQTLNEYSSITVLGLTALGVTYTYLHPKRKADFHNRLTHVHTMVFFIAPMMIFIPCAQAANLLKDYLLLPTHSYYFTTRAAASFAMGVLTAWQEKRSLIKGAIYDGVINLALGSLPLYRVMSNAISKLSRKTAAIIPTNFINHAIANLGALKTGEILCELSFSLIKNPPVIPTTPTVTDQRCLEIQTFKFLECDQGPLSQAVQAITAPFRSSQTLTKIKEICADLKNTDPCVKKVF